MSRSAPTSTAASPRTRSTTCRRCRRCSRSSPGRTTSCTPSPTATGSACCGLPGDSQRREHLEQGGEVLVAEPGGLRGRQELVCQRGRRQRDLELPAELERQGEVLL